MDVDNLGRIFSQGFNKMAGKDNKKYVGKVKPGATISRVSSLSAYLDMFFSGIINEIAQNYRVFDEVAPEDFALCEFVDTSKLKLQKIVREGLNYLRKEEA
jgi:CRISPR-associated protein Csm1